jgi:hypothetical protein
MMNVTTWERMDLAQERQERRVRNWGVGTASEIAESPRSGIWR